MTILQQTITIILCALGTMLTRFLPFLVFNPKKPTPKYIQYQPAPVEETNAALHRGRHGVLYAAGAVRVLILISTERKMFPCAYLT